jgi:two-component system chemotaxis response regulator CheB
MPERTLALVDGGARVLAASEIGPAIAGLDGGPTADPPASERTAPGPRPSGPPTGFTCPECTGPLWEVRRGDVVRYRCRVGHEFSEPAMVALQGTAVERALYTALEVLEERAELLRRVAEGRPREQETVRNGFLHAAEHADERAELIRRALAAGDDIGATDAPG